MLDEIIKDILEEEKNIIRNGNILREVEDLKVSYFEESIRLKAVFINCNKEALDYNFMLLREARYFSAGYDFAYKKKIEADCFMEMILESIILPEMYAEVHSLFNDMHVIPENNDREKNISAVEHIVQKHVDFNSLLFLLYVYDWQFPKGWKELYPDTGEELEQMIIDSKLTVGEFLRALVEYKMNCIMDIVNSISDQSFRMEYIGKVNDLKKQQLKKVNSFPSVSLPVGYFFDHTMLDFLKREPVNPIILS